MREKLIDLLCFLNSVYVMDSRTIRTCSHIDAEMIKDYANIIEKILSDDVILVDKNKLERKFEERPVDINEKYITARKEFSLCSQIRLTIFDYKTYKNDKCFQDYVNETLTNRMLDYFISDVGVKDKSEQE